MELANLWGDVSDRRERVRRAVPGDGQTITRLLQTAPYSHIHADWHLPADWLGTPGFVLYAESEPPRQTAVTRFVPRRSTAQGCLAVAADPPPAAWVRVAAVANVAQPQAVLAAMLASTLPHLQETGVTELAWLVIGQWPNEWLSALNFTRVNYVETYLKDDMEIPPVAAIPDLTIRPVRSEDMETLARIEAEAFAPIWRHSASLLALAARETLSFDVALLDRRIVGFQFSACNRTGAHLVRLTITPALQGQGLGSALLAHALHGYRRAGLQTVSLNTQVDNFASQRLYQKFGFYGSGQRLPVWVLSF